MEVTILKGQVTAKDADGNIFNIQGIKIIRQQSKAEIFYGTTDSFYLAAAAENTTSNAYKLNEKDIMLL